MSSWLGLKTTLDLQYTELIPKVGGITSLWHKIHARKWKFFQSSASGFVKVGTNAKYHIRVCPRIIYCLRYLYSSLLTTKPAQRWNVPMSTFDFLTLIISHNSSLFLFYNTDLSLTPRCNITFSVWFTDREFILLEMRVIFKLATKNIPLCVWMWYMCRCVWVCV